VRGHSTRDPSQPMATKPSSNQRVANRDASIWRMPAANTRKTLVGNLANAFWKPWTVRPGRRRFGKHATQKALAVSKRSGCESPQHQVIRSNTRTNGCVPQRGERRWL
jgi:hypothetical protein